MEGKRFVLAVLLVFLCLSLVVGCESSTYDKCINKCLDRAREQNIDRDDITNAEYQRIMREHEIYICPGRCEPLKPTPTPK